MWIKAKYTFIKTIYSPRFYGGPFMRAKHADVCSGVLFWTVCTRRSHVLSLPSRWKIRFMTASAVSENCQKSHEGYHNVVMWHWIVYKWRRSNQMLSFRRTFFNWLDLTVSLSCRDWHSETPWSHSSNQPGGTYCQAQDLLLRTNYTLEMWCANIQNRQIKSPSALWKHLSFKCLGVIVALNGKSASMLLEPTKNKLKQCQVIEKSVNECNFFLRCFEIITKWMEITDRQICEDQIVTFKQSHILLYQGLLFWTRSTCVIVDARSHTCKSHDFIPRYDINACTLAKQVR